jgi:hypothetical protein
MLTWLQLQTPDKNTTPILLTLQQKIKTITHYQAYKHYEVIK